SCWEPKAAATKAKGTAARPSAAAPAPKSSPWAPRAIPITTAQKLTVTIPVAPATAATVLRATARGSAIEPLRSRRRPGSTLHRTGGETPDEVALQAEEDRQRHDHGQERPRGEQVPSLSPRPVELIQG